MYIRLYPLFVSHTATEILGKPLKWQLIPIRLDLKTFEALKRIALEGNVKKLIEEAIQKLIRT